MMKKVMSLSFAAFLLLILNACSDGGCTEILADNYSPYADFNDGSCLYQNSLETKEYVIYSKDFKGGNGYYYYTYEFPYLTDNDGLFMEWKCFNCANYSVLPHVIDNDFTVRYERNGRFVHVIIELFDVTKSIYDSGDYFDLINGSIVKLFVIDYKTMDARKIDVTDLDAQEEFVRSQE